MLHIMKDVVKLMMHKMIIPNLKVEDETEIVKALHDVWGIRHVTVNPTMNEVIFSFNEAAGSMEDFQQAVIDLGYEVEGVMSI